MCLDSPAARAQDKGMNDLSKLTDDELASILLTCDGRGKEVKQIALRLLLRRFTLESKANKTSWNILSIEADPLIDEKIDGWRKDL